MERFGSRGTFLNRSWKLRVMQQPKLVLSSGGRLSHNGTLKAPLFMTDVAAVAHHVTTAGVRS
eukprot:3037783-Prymnesium_polylepis.1